MSRPIVTAVALVIAALASSAQAVRVIEQVERPVELALGELALPTDATGQVTYRACPTCALESHSLTQDTLYNLNGQAMSFEDFLAGIDEIRAMPSVEARAFAGVFFDVNTERVTRVIVRASGAF